MRRLGSTLGAIALLVGAGASEAAASGLSASLSRDMQQIGGSSSALVVDLTTKQTLFSQAAGVPRIPASVEKVYTTSTALLRFGPNATLTTSVRGIGSVAADGTWTGTLFLVGGGDPTFGSKGFDRSTYGTGATMHLLLGHLLSATRISAVAGRIVGDESYFDSARGTDVSGYRSDLTDVAGELSALAYDRGFANLSGTQLQQRPALYAAQQFASALRAAGVSVPSSTPVYTGPTPAGARTLATVNSPRMAKLIYLTNTPSDNFLAEMLLKAIGARFGHTGSTAAGAAVVRSVMAGAFHIRPQVADGSGLSRSDATSPSQVVSLLTGMSANRAFVGSLAIAGKTGTLEDYSHGTAAEGNCQGKTGTLHDVADLVGYCHARDGHTLAFAVLANSISDPLAVHSVEADQIAPALASYNG
jgi:D-alanyl-D-alanine carboxypeptidase/D-alanyl-D-alanine-endopeptidase (penicillin-binding protein 4)